MLLKRFVDSEIKMADEKISESKGPAEYWRGYSEAMKLVSQRCPAELDAVGSVKE